MKTSRTNEYQLKKDEQGTVWVNIQPLQRDIVEHLKILNDIDITHFSEQDIKDLELKMLGLNQIYGFLGALLSEQKLNDYREQFGEQK
jgi:hypothetical protein